MSACIHVQRSTRVGALSMGHGEVVATTSVHAYSVAILLYMCTCALSMAQSERIAAVNPPPVLRKIPLVFVLSPSYPIRARVHGQPAKLRWHLECLLGDAATLSAQSRSPHTVEMPRILRHSVRMYARSRDHQCVRLPVCLCPSLRDTKGRRGESDSTHVLVRACVRLCLRTRALAHA
jgi:hypothetical protein